MKRKTIHLLLMAFLITGITACNNNEQGLNDGTNQGENRLNDSISSMSTGTPSSKYPHTKPILTQGAKYDFRVINGRGFGQQAFDTGKAPGTSQEQPQATPGNNQQEAQQTPQQAQPAQEQQTPQQAVPATGVSATESKVIQLTNAERRRNGLPDLQADTPLSKVAREKSNDMQTKGYFSHTSPTYGSPFDMMRDFGISYQSAGENIAQGQPTAEEVVQAWMNSEGHRKNILSADFTHIGVGHNTQGNYWTQMFIKK